MVKELSIENYLSAQAKALGGFTVKLVPLGLVGIPDRLVVLPRGRIIFVEVKRPRGGRIARLQHWWQERLHALGHEAVFVKTRQEVLDLLTPEP